MKLNFKRTFYIGLAFLSISAFWQMYDNIIPLILKNNFGMKDSIIGIIMAMDNVLAVFLLPIVGSISDGVDTRLGKRTPFIIVGTIATVIFMLLMPLATKMGNIVLFIVALGITLVALSMYRSPAVALMPDLTPKPLRSKANAVINLMGAVGAIYALIIIKLLMKSNDYSFLAVFVGIAIIMIIAVIVLVLKVNEKKIVTTINLKDEAGEAESKSINDMAIGNKLSKEIRRSLVFILISIFLWFTAYNAVTTAFSRYAKEVWGMKDGGFTSALMVATIAAILSYIPIGIIASKIGRKRSILIGIVMMTISYFVAFFFVEYGFLINLFFVLIGIGWASISVNSLPMVVEMSKSADIGKYTGLYYTFSMSAQIFTPIASGFVLQYVSYRMLFPYAVVFSICAFATMMMVKHGDSIPDKKSCILENYDVED